MRLILIITILSLVSIGISYGQEIAPAAQDSLRGDILEAGSVIGQGLVRGAAPIVNAGATVVDWITDNAISYVIITINYVIGFIGAIFITLAGLLIQFGMALNNTIMDSEVVLIGWRVVRDITNLGFVIGIIVIAYSTMLRIENYAMKKTLAKLIAAALLVNFSLTIAGIFIDSSHIFTNFFVTKTIGGGFESGLSMTGLDKLASNIASAFSPQKLLQVDSQNLNAFSSLAGTTAGLLSMVASTFFVTLFTIFAAEGMLAIAIMILYRYIVLSILLIVMPMAFLLWAFPALEKHWKTWWSKFIEQILFLPVSMFFVYLAIVMVNIKAETSASPQNLAFQVNEASGQAFTEFLKVMSTPFSNIGQMLVVLGLLIGGLFTAKKLGAVGADTAIMTATAVRNGILGQVGKMGGARGIKAAQKLGEYSTKVRQAVLGGTKTNLKGVAGETSLLTPAQQRRQFVKDYSAMSQDKRMEIARAKNILSDPIKMAAMAAVLAQKDEFDQLVPKEQLEGKTEEERRRIINDAFEPFKQAAIKSNDREILKYMPHLAKDFGLDIDRVMQEITSLEDVSKINYQAFENADVVTKLSSNQIKYLGTNGNERQREAVVKTLLKSGDAFSAQDKTKLESFVKVMRTDLSGGWTGTLRLDELVNKTSQKQPFIKIPQPTPITPPPQPSTPKIGTDGAQVKKYPLPPSFFSTPTSPSVKPTPSTLSRPSIPPPPPFEVQIGGRPPFIPPPTTEGGTAPTPTRPPVQPKSPSASNK